MAMDLVPDHFAYGLSEPMAEAVAGGARPVEGVTADLRRVPELVPDEVARQSCYKLDQAAPIATVDELEHQDAIIIIIIIIGTGTGTRFCTASSQLCNVLDQTDGTRFQGRHIAGFARKQFG